MPLYAAITHKTSYEYDRRIHLSPQVIRLRPAPHCRTPVESYSIRVEPEGHFLNWLQDPFGNFEARVVFPEKVNHFSVTVDLSCDMTVINPFDFFIDEYAEKLPFQYEDSLKDELSPYFKVSDSSPQLEDWMKLRVPEVFSQDTGTIDFLVELNRRVYEDIGYIIRMEPGVQSCETTLDSKKGSCRDSAFLLVQILRKLGYAARFVSGYLIQLKADQKETEGPSGPEQDFTDLHAWTEVFLPGAGWVGLDPTSGLFAGEGHIPLAATPEPGGAAPITGLADPCEVKFQFHMEVRRERESPRVTLPYTEDTWSAIYQTGLSLDKRLDEQQVRMMMGGEPTFVSRTDMEAAEWTIEAPGKDKEKKGRKLLEILRARYAPGGLLFFGQGKWYPGEALPRWAYSCYFRKDGKPIWKNDLLIAGLKDSSSSSRDQKHNGDSDANADRMKDMHFVFMRKLAEKLGLSPERVIPAYEDVYYDLWKEGNIPASIDFENTDFRDPQEWKKIRSRLEQSAEPVGSLLPLTKSPDGKGWIAGEWIIRRERLFLIPGDSPMGLRIPLDSIFRAADLAGSFQEEKSPLADFEDLDSGENPEYGTDQDTGEESRLWEELAEEKSESQITEESDRTDGKEKENKKLDSRKIYTTLATQYRDGSFRVFLPPIRILEDYLEIVHHIEQVASELSCPLVLEGYPPPTDPRISHFSLTPDPGVLEVNIHPSSSWKEIVEKNEFLYEQAREIGLGTEKYLIDGRHSGTGGGNHVTIGGEKPLDSPFFRRPDLLSSMIRFWQNHPSLSYLFSGLFIGPTSQHPRVDEARHENLYELETALSAIPERKEKPPWFLDRLLRNLLVDITGNTHRAEFSIDKLHSPDSLSGRQGILEIRSFEMPPHWRMSSVQSLLIRSLVSRFWDRPYKNHLIRWGTALHDRYLLPHFVWLDFEDVIQDLSSHGLSIQADWFLPFYEFRFPWIGETSVRGVILEFRTALEVWNVLGEEASSQGTARYVDSSVERIQVKAKNFHPERYLVLVNGVEIPMQKTDTVGEAVGAVRFKAWSPHSSLHPHIKATPVLVFDLYDTFNHRSLGGATYYVSHPGGRNPETFPVNAFEAQSRRAARFESRGHTPAEFKTSITKQEKEFSHTLDLRKYSQ